MIIHGGEGKELVSNKLSANYCDDSNKRLAAVESPSTRSTDDKSLQSSQNNNYVESSKRNASSNRPKSAAAYRSNVISTPMTGVTTGDALYGNKLNPTIKVHITYTNNNKFKIHQ